MFRQSGFDEPLFFRAQSFFVINPISIQLHNLLDNLMPLFRRESRQSHCVDLVLCVEGRVVDEI